MQAKAGTILTHCIGWLIFLFLPLLFINGQNENASFIKIILSGDYWLFLFCYAFLFYSHTYYVFPKWYENKRYALYGFFLLAAFIFIFFISPFDQLVGFADHERPRFERPPQRPDMPFPPHRGPDGKPGPRGVHFDIVSIVLYFLTLALSIAAITLRQLRMSKEKAMRAETEKAQAELSYLKAQINPHFLFNTLNNIYVLATGSHENTAPAILKLSNILRYVTEEISDDFVRLDKEVNCISDYIDLQQLRISNKTKILFETSGDFTGYRVPPMVLMTYIENAFKFGISNREESLISIRISTRNEEIDFECSNKIFDTKGRESTGIGLINTKQRLDYLYKEKYDLRTDQSNGIYTVRLRLRN